MRKNERGIALITVLFATLLLTVIGLGMMYSTNMETSINHNYRESQVALYAALAGLQEARQRIKFPYEITPPEVLPSTTAANIIYIVSDASTVQPWDPANTYFDTELCQEHVLGLTGTPGVPCTMTASGTSWYQVVDDSQSSSAPWNLSYPLDWKWTRIQLKGNNNTPVPVNGDGTDSSQACWSGTSQMSTPTSYTTGCQPRGEVTSVSVVSHGTTYTSAPTVAFSGGGGTGATAHAVLGNETTGVISSIAVTAGGLGYTTPPTVTFGSGAATATAVLATTGATVVTAGSVTSATVDDGGSGYITEPTVTFSGGGGSGAAGTAVLSTVGTVTTTGYVNSVNVTTPGSSYTSPPTVNLTGGGGSGAAATATLGTTGIVKTVAVDSAGTQCYSTASDAVITFNGGAGTGAAASAVLETTRSCVYAVAVTTSPQCANKLDAAHGYSPIDQKSGVTFTAGNGSFSGTLFVRPADDKSPTSLSVQNPGNDSSGYSAATFTSQLKLTSGAWADCNNITATATTGYRIASITVTSAGSGYTSTPTVNITGGVGSTSNPTALVTRGFPVTGFTVTSGGSNYTSIPSVGLSGGGGSGAAGTATIITTSTTTYPVLSINLTSGGAGYTSAPMISFSGGGGSGATATAAISTLSLTTYAVSSITVTSGGTGYDAALPPTVTLSGGGGSGATATATVTSVNTGTFFVDHIDVDTTGSGYTTNPTVTLSGGGGSGATASSQISGGTKYGKVWLLTSLAQTRNGARSMVQAEVASPVLGFAPGGPLTLDGPNPVIDAMPNSIGFYIRGSDANSCHDPDPEPDQPAIDGFDDPNASPPTASVETIIDSLPVDRLDHYLGAGGTPSVQNGFGTMGETMTTPAGMDSVMAAIYNTPGAHHYTAANVSTFDPNTTTASSINYVEGDLDLNGNGTGHGVLVVTGTLTMNGNFSWYGIIFVVGDGHVEMNGGGNGEVHGSIWVAKTWDMSHNLLSSLGSPTFSWNGGGINSMQYDHCLVSNLLTAVDTTHLTSTRPLKILSYRSLPY